MAKILLKKSIYPTQKEFREETEEYLFENHEDYISDFTTKSWNVMYEKYFYRNVSFS